VTGQSAGALPTVIVIGAQKCGTSALHAYLGVHPEISMSKPKELDFFLAERNWRRGLDWYRRHFDPRRPVRGESSPNYTAYPTWQGVAARVGEVVPGVKLIYLVRDPLDRIASHWVHNWSVRRELEAPAAALRRRSTYIDRSRYMYQLDQFLPHVRGDRILVLDQLDLRSRRSETLERVFRFLEVDPGFRHPSFAVEVHGTGGKRRMSHPAAAIQRRIGRSPLRRIVPAGAIARIDGALSRTEIERPDIRSALPPEALEALRGDARRLREFTGMALDHWSV
jgi:hypothetical protein